ncbi:E3 ubiquitin-protein ligase UBR7 [Metschnikowia aff. pulcherrima]|uniref:E3 ubiquitin-protein ligase UBR7 n=1 Tax=Metschnikowia aff. pulcherrima TaxID=2163413 RepID=A0A4P6XUY0_9ASCO|nr:E3 ubiquitin-protein ligase UBR7 [Metschnikowia aff. pulcherrima]
MKSESSSIVPSESRSDDESVTAVEFLENQLKLEKEAREALPYEPDTCTYPQALRQLVSACLTCRLANDDANIGVCYSCLIQCHSTHELVELFSKRNFVCDCGTSKMKEGKACAIRTRQLQVKEEPPSQIPRMRSGSFSAAPSSGSISFSSKELPLASDIESLGNNYNQNFAGHFCSCSVLYNPVLETQTMHQCYLGDVCGEDWFHQECILGYKPGAFVKSLFEGSGENKLDDLPPPGVDAASETVAKIAQTGFENDPEEPVPHFPSLDSFGEFICWKCVSKHNEAFDELSRHKDIVVCQKPHFTDVTSADEWADREAELETEQLAKRQKTESNSKFSRAPCSLFLKEKFHVRLALLKDQLPESSSLCKLLRNFEFLTVEDPIYQPEEEDVVSTQASEGSLYDMGSTALLALPLPQALEGLEAYDVMKEKLRGFFKEFVDQKKVVTEDEVRDFFGKMKKE